MKILLITAATYAAIVAIRLAFDVDPGQADLITQTLAALGDRRS